MVAFQALSTGQTGDERRAFGSTLSTDPRRGDCLSRDQTAGGLLPLLCAPRDGCDEGRRLGRGVSQISKRQYFQISPTSTGVSGLSAAGGIHHAVHAACNGVFSYATLQQLK